MRARWPILCLLSSKCWARGCRCSTTTTMPDTTCCARRTMGFCVLHSAFCIPRDRCLVSLFGARCLRLQYCTDCAALHCAVSPTVYSTDSPVK